MASAPAAALPAFRFRPLQGFAGAKGGGMGVALMPGMKRPNPFQPASVHPLSRLTERIASVHNTALRAELERMDALTAKVAAAHRLRDPRLSSIRKEYLELAEDLSEHMAREERVLFPLIRELEAAPPEPFSHCASLANIIRKMASENEHAEASFQRIRDLADGYILPAGASPAHQAMLAGLDSMEASFREHMRMEHAELFSNAIKLEEAKDSLSIQRVKNAAPPGKGVGTH